MIFQLLIEKLNDGSFMVVVNVGRGDESTVFEDYREAHEFVDKKLTAWFKVPLKSRGEE